MSNSFIEMVNIDSLVRSLKQKYKIETKEQISEIIANSLASGVSFRNQIIKTHQKKYFNKFTKIEESRYYFKCPQCDSPVRNIYSAVNEDLGCRKCCKIKSKSRVNSQADRVLKIQKYLHELFSGKKLSSKKKRQLTNYIVNHYNSLDDKYKLAYNTFVFKELQNWCLDKIVDNATSLEYRKAVKDVLGILKSSKKILVRTGLAKPSKKEFKI